uniref:Uncharacterized protein n=1 Tax=Zea mays TaxID=4577 RepID=C4J8F0_MAIZE|nr:unknown [Zea mays]
MHDDRGRVHARNHNLPLRIRSPRAVVVVVLLFSTLLIYYTETLELMNMHDAAGGVQTGEERH